MLRDTTTTGIDSWKGKLFLRRNFRPDRQGVDESDTGSTDRLRLESLPRIIRYIAK
jgi:hypothetical protein